jgi:hypothetical protein
MTEEFIVLEQRSESFGWSYAVTVKRCKYLIFESPVDIQAYISSDNQWE